MYLIYINGGYWVYFATGIYQDINPILHKPDQVSNVENLS